MLKPTMSKDGVKRINRRVTFRLDGDDFANILCLKFREHEPEDGPLPDLPKAKILQLVDEALGYRADARHWWQDDINDEDFASELWKWADELVRRKFPELY